MSDISLGDNITVTPGTPVLTLTVNNTSTDASVAGSLGWAIAQANAYTGEGTLSILFSETLTDAVFEIGGCMLTQDVSLTTNGQPVTLGGMLWVPEGVTVTVGPGIGVRYADVCGTMVMEQGSTADGGNLEVGQLMVYEGGQLVFEGGNVVSQDDGVAIIYLNDGASLVAQGTRFEVPVCLSAGSSVSGENITFAAETPLYLTLDNWDGSASGIQSALDSILQGTTYTLEHEAPILQVTASLYEETLVLGSNDSLAPTGFADVALSLFLTDSTVTVEQGVDLKVNYLSVYEGGQLVFEGDNVVRQGDESMGIRLTDGASLVAQGTRFEVPLYLSEGSSVSGENITFAAETLGLTLDNWDGSASGIQSALDTVLQGTTYTLEHEAPILQVTALVYEETLVIGGDSLAPVGFADVKLALSLTDSNVTVEPGTDLNVSAMALEGGSSLTMEGGSLLTPDCGVIAYCSEEDGTPGSVVMNGVDLNGAQFMSMGGDVSLTNCTGLKELTVDSMSYGDGEIQTGTICITGCDLSQTSIMVSVMDDAVIDLSGNYWGTTDLEEIKARIEGYDESCVTIGNILTEAPDISGGGGTPDAPEEPKPETNIFTVTNSSADATVEGSLGWAVAQANAYTGEGAPSIHLQGVASEDVITGTEHTLTPESADAQETLPLLQIADSLTLNIGSEGAAYDSLTIEELRVADGKDVVIRIAAGSTVTLADVNFTGNVRYELGEGSTLILSASDCTPGCISGSGTVLFSGGVIDATTVPYSGEHALWFQGGERAVSGGFLQEDFVALVLQYSAEGSSLTYGIASDASVGLNVSTGSGSLSTGSVGYNLVWNGEGTRIDVVPDSPSEMLTGSYAPGAQFDITQDVYLSSDGLPAILGATLNVEEGVTATVGSGICTADVIVNGTMEMEQGASLGGDATVLTGGTLSLNATRVDGCIALHEGAALVGADNIFTGSGDVLYLYSPAVNLSGFAGTAEAADATIGLVGGALSDDATLALLGEGLGTYRLDSTLSVKAGATLRIEDGACLRSEQYGHDLIIEDGGCLIAHGGRLELLGHETDEGGDLSGLIVEAGATVLMTGATIEGYASTSSSTGEDYCTIYVKAGGILELTDCNLVKVTKFHLEKGSTLVMENCEIEDIIIESGEGVVIRDSTFSGSLWWYVPGTSAPTPSGTYTPTDVPPPTIVNCNTPLTLHEPILRKLGDNQVEVTLVWSGTRSQDEFASYVLDVAGERVELTATTTHTLVLADGSYDYKVTMTDTDGKVYSLASSFTCDSLAPDVRLLAPTFTKDEAGQMKVTLAWSGEDDSRIHYVVRVDEEVVYGGYGTSCWAIVPDGEYTCTIIATDAYGNQSKVQGSFVSDSSLSGLEISSVVMNKLSEGRTEVTISWTSNGSESYTLTVDGKAYTVEGTEYTLTLADGQHKYGVTMTDSAGNPVTAEGRFTCDATAPQITLNRPQLQKVSDEMVLVTLSWYSSESDATYELLLNGESHQLEKPQFSVTLPAGEFGYTIIATDDRGNSVTLNSSVTVDFAAPVVTLNEPKMLRQVTEGVAMMELSWTSSKEATYELVIDGQLVYRGRDTSYNLRVPDGEHHYTLTATDDVDNVVEVVGEPFWVDATSPVLTLGKPVSEKLSEGLAQVTLSWACSEEGCTYELLVDGETVEGVTSNSAILELEDGEHSYSLRATDAAGNSSKVTSDSFVVDATAPTLTLHEPETEKRKEGLTRVTFSWTSSEKADYTLTVNGESWELSDTSKTLDLADGVYSYSLTATDAYGNVSTLAAEAPLVLDATSPELSVDIPSLTNSTMLSWSGEEGAFYTVEIDGEVLYSGNNTQCVAEGLTEGKHNYVITAVDAANNETVKKGSFTYDSLPPNEPVLREVKLVKLGENLSRVTVSWEAQKGATYLLSIDGGDEIVLTGTSYTCEVEDGVHMYYVKAKDSAGNESDSANGDFTADTIAPVLNVLDPVVSPSDVEPGMADFYLSWSTGEDAVTYTLKIDGKTCFTGEETEFISQLKDGAHEYILSATDEAGNTSSMVGSFYIDVTPPALKLGKPQYARVGEGQMEVRLSWSGELGSTFTVEIGDDVLYEGTDSNCSFIYDDGEHEYTVTATDAAGNVTVKEGVLDFDASAPVGVALFEVDEEKDIEVSTNKGKGKVTFRWEGEEGCTYTLMVDGKKAYSGKAMEKTLTLKDGEHSYSVIARDKAGNTVEVAGEQFLFSFDATAPTITLDVPGIVYCQAPDSDDEEIIREGGTVTLNWHGSEDYVTYTLSVMQGKEVIIDALELDLDTTEYTTEWLANGKYSYALVARDDAGNYSGVKKGSFTVASGDITPPEIVDFAHSVKDGKNGTASVTISWKGSEKGSTYTLMVNGDIAYVGTATKRTLTLEAGSHSYSIIATDKAGNRSEEATGELTYSAPMIDQRATTLSWAPQEGSSYVLKVDNKLVSPTDSSSYNWAGLKDGKHKYTLTATDEAGNITTYSGSFVADTKAPKVTLGKAKTSKAGEGLMNATLSWKGEKGATYTLTVDDGEGITIEGGSSASVSYTLRGLADGKHIYTVTATDAAGNTSVAAEGSFSHDATAPDVILGGISGVAVTSKGKTYTKVSFSWVGEDGVSYTVMVDGKKQKVSKLTTTTSNLAAGEHSYTIIAKDKAGNISTTTGSFTTDGEGNASWGNTASGAPVLSVIPDGAQSLVWGGADTNGISSADVTDAANGYSFELESARQLIVKLDGLSEDATVILQQAGGQGSISLAANGAAGLDRELSLSAGTYYLQVLGSDGASALAGGYTLDLELEKNGKKQPMQQASLAASL